MAGYGGCYASAKPRRENASAIRGARMAGLLGPLERLDETLKADKVYGDLRAGPTRPGRRRAVDLF